MKFKMLLLLILFALIAITSKVPAPVWHESTNTWSCPAGWTPVAGENDLMAGKDFVRCSR